MGVHETMRISNEVARPALVLVTTDTEWSARSLETLLNPHGYVVVRAASDTQVAAIAVSTHPDLVILEHRLPHLDAIATCRTLREDPRFELGTPILVVTSSPVERAQRIAIFEAGAWNHWTQPVDTEVLLRQIRTLTAVRRQLDRLQHASLLEAATGIYSSRGLAQRAREIGAAARRRRGPLTCVAMALELDPPIARDDLSAGALLQAARQLSIEWQRYARVSDLLGRLGPAEFGIVTPDTGLEGARHLIDRLKQRVEAIPLAVEGTDIVCQVRVHAECVGVLDSASAATDALELLRHARLALHGAEPGHQAAAPPTAEGAPAS